MYDYIKEHLPFFPFVFIVILIAGWFMFGTAKLNEQRIIEQTGKQLDDIGKQQQELKKTTERAGRAIGESTRRNNDLQNNNHSDADIIRESKLIIAELKRRNAQEGK